MLQTSIKLIYIKYLLIVALKNGVVVLGEEVNLVVAVVVVVVLDKVLVLMAQLKKASSAKSNVMPTYVD